MDSECDLMQTDLCILLTMIEAFVDSERDLMQTTTDGPDLSPVECDGVKQT